MALNHKNVVNEGLRCLCCDGYPIWPICRHYHNTQSHLCPLCVTTMYFYHVFLVCHSKNFQNKLLGDLKSSFIPLQIHKHYSLFSSLPQIACLAFLSFQYPLFLFKGFNGTEKNNATEVSFDLSACSSFAISASALIALIAWPACITNQIQDL